MRLIEARGARPFVVIFLVVTAVLVVIVGLDGGWTTWNNPRLTWRGYANYAVAKYAAGAGIIFFVWVLGWLLMQLLLSTGGLGLVYGFTRRGKVYLGSWLGMLGVPWRRVECVDRVKVVLKPAYRPASQSQFVIDHHRVVVTSGGRTCKVQALAPLDPTSGLRVRRWLEEKGLNATLVDPLSDR